MLRNLLRTVKSPAIPPALPPWHPPGLQSDPPQARELSSWADGVLLARADREQKHPEGNEQEEDLVFMLPKVYGGDQNASCNDAWGLLGVGVPTWVQAGSLVVPCTPEPKTLRHSRWSLEEPCDPRCQTEAIDCLDAQRTTTDFILKRCQPPSSNSELPCLLCGNLSQRLTAFSSFSFIFLTYRNGLGLPGGSDGKESACIAGDLGSTPGLGRSPGEGNGYPLQFSGLENSMGCIVYGVTKSQTQLNDFHFHFSY